MQFERLPMITIRQLSIRSANNRVGIQIKPTFHSYETRCNYSSDKPKTRENGAKYCLESVRKHDHENFLAVLLLPAHCREDVLAIRAFNIELAQLLPFIETIEKSLKVTLLREMCSYDLDGLHDCIGPTHAVMGRDEGYDLLHDRRVPVGVTSTREMLAGMMRLQFWRDTLDAVYKGQPPAQPVARALHGAVERRKLSKRWLQQLIGSREGLLHKPGFDSTAELETYAENSNSVLYYLTLQAAGVSSLSADHCASHAGKGEAVLRLLRGVPFLASKRQVLLPRDLMIKHGVSDEDVLRGSTEQKVKDVVFEVASLANHHIEQARSLSRGLTQEARVALLPTVSAAAALARLQRYHFHAFEPRLQQRNTWLPLQLWLAKFRRRL